MHMRTLPKNKFYYLHEGRFIGSWYLNAQGTIQDLDVVLSFRVREDEIVRISSPMWFKRSWLLELVKLHVAITMKAVWVGITPSTLQGIDACNVMPLAGASETILMGRPLECCLVYGCILYSRTIYISAMRNVRTC